MFRAHTIIGKDHLNFRYYRRTCRNQNCDAAIAEDTIISVKTGAGLKLEAYCRNGHKTSFYTCEHLNKHRTSIFDIKLCVLQLVTGLGMSQECDTIIIFFS